MAFEQLSLRLLFFIFAKSWPFASHILSFISFPLPLSLFHAARILDTYYCLIVYGCSSIASHSRELSSRRWRQPRSGFRHQSALNRQVTILEGLLSPVGPRDTTLDPSASSWAKVGWAAWQRANHDQCERCPSQHRITEVVRLYTAGIHCPRRTEQSRVQSH